MNRYKIYLKYICKEFDMKVAIIGSRNLRVINLEDCIPQEQSTLFPIAKNKTKR